jgi:hypothetical protein
MGLFDRFRRSAPQPQPQPETFPGERRFGLDRERMFDIGRTGRLAGLLAVPREQRAPDWYDAFWDAAWLGSVELAEPRVFAGPDGFPYLRLQVPGPGAFDSQCLANLAGDCRKNGVGAAFFASPGAPPEAAQYVLSLGLIDSLLRYDSPDGDPIDRAEAALPEDISAFSTEQSGFGQRLTVEREHQVLVGTPSAEYLPPPVARALHVHLRERWALDEPRVALVVDASMRPHRTLVIGRKRSDFADQAEMDDRVQRLVWFLTPGRLVMPMPEDWSVDEMTPLRALFEA